MERSGMLSPTCSATVRLQRTKLRNEFELTHRTPQLNKHGVVHSLRQSTLKKYIGLFFLLQIPGFLSVKSLPDLSIW
jgi:hypothetical protein